MRLSDVSNLAIATDSADGVFADGKFVVQLGEGKCRNDGLKPFSPKLFLIVAKMSLPKRSAPYWSNPLSSIFYIRALWCSVLSARVTKCRKG